MSSSGDLEIGTGGDVLAVKEGVRVAESRNKGETGDGSVDEGKAMSIALLACTCAGVASGERGSGGVAGSVVDGAEDTIDKPRVGRSGETSAQSGEEGVRAAWSANRDGGDGESISGETGAGVGVVGLGKYIVGSRYR